MDDFAECGMVDMRGRHNYSCHQEDNTSCADGRVMGCKDAGCPYVQARERFLTSSLSVTSYAYILSSILYGDGIGSVDLLILDEAHTALSELASALEMKIDHKRNQFLYSESGTPPYGRPIEDWKQWATIMTPKVSGWIARAKADGNEKVGRLRAADQLKRDLDRLSKLLGDWVVDEETTPGITLISPLWPTDYAHLLFGAAKKRILVSASLVRKTTDLLNVKPEELLMLSTAYTFDPNRAPVYLMGDCAIDHKTSHAQWIETFGRMDTFIKLRQDRKGLVHTVSYANQRKVQDYSNYSNFMLCPDSSSLMEALAQFRRAEPPRVLVSPAITTGYDFKYGAAEFQVILKTPFLDTRSPVMLARCRKDPEYSYYITAQTITQECGRIMRAPDDQGETAVLDRHLKWMLKPKSKKGYRHLFPEHFLGLVRYQDGQPTPPPALARGHGGG